MTDFDNWMPALNISPNMIHHMNWIILGAFSYTLSAAIQVKLEEQILSNNIRRMIDRKIELESCISIRMFS